MLEKLKDPNYSPDTIEELCDIVLFYNPEADIEKLKRVYEYSDKAHSGQIRRSGEPYISHPLSVASILAHLRMDLETIFTGLLHDTVEDTEATLDEIKKQFGEEVSYLVDGVTKISQIKFRHTHQKQGENIRKMIVAMGKDVRVVLVKLADRLHNMRTLHHMPFDKQESIAKETLDIYAPLASRLGINWLKVELEDLSFRFSNPEAYYDLSQKVQERKNERERYIEDVKKIISQHLNEKLKTDFRVKGRSKHLYSIHKKMFNNGINYEQVYDILAFRLILQNVSECYEALGHIHSMWRPIPGRFKDFIAMPKSNNYQSLHTTIIGPKLKRIEIQIRTEKMDLVAEQGIAAHWKYKELEMEDQRSKTKDLIEGFNWLRDLVSMHQNTGDADEFLENVKSDLFESDIYVFTPKGEVMAFPEGATPIDFAFSVHTEVGLRCAGARVNGRGVPLKYKLQNGDFVEILTLKKQTPSKDWLRICVTSRAKTKIRSFIKIEERKKACGVGEILLDKAFKKLGLSFSKYTETEELQKFMKDKGCNSSEDLKVQVGYGKILPANVTSLFKDIEHEKSLEPETNFFQRAFKSAVQKNKKSSSMVLVDGMSEFLVHYAKCCNPIPGDSIFGFVTLGRGIVVHRADCPRTFEIDEDRRVDVRWSDGEVLGERMVRVRVVSSDTRGLLVRFSEVFNSKGINIHNVQIKTTRDDKAISLFDVSVKDTSHLAEVMQELQKIPTVIGVTRMALS